MRILNVTQSYAPFYEFGGPPAKVEALSNGLAKRGHQVTVLTADWGYQKRQANDGGAVGKRGAFGWVHDANGVNSVYLPTWLHYRAASWNPAATGYCNQNLDGFEIVHIFGLYDLLGPTVAAACRKRGIPYVVEPIGMFVPIVRNIFLKRMYHTLLGEKMISGAAAMIATAEQEVQELAASGIPRDKIILRRNGVAAPRVLPASGTFRAEFGIPSEAHLGLFLGRLSEKKGPELLLEAFAGLPAAIDGRAVWLVFAGPDESGMTQRLQESVRRSGVQERVIFSGAIFGMQKWAAYRDADVFVLPSQNENFGNTAAEAAACGTPVVITENCGVAPLLAGAAGLVVPHETTAVARAVQQVLSEPELRSRLSEGGKSTAGRLSWDQPVSAMESMYRELAARRPVVGQSASQE